MPQTSARDMRNLSDEDLQEREQELREELFNLRFQFTAGELANHAHLTLTKKELARVLTVLRERRHVE